MLNSLSNAQDIGTYDYYQALREYENKNYKKALSKFDTLINLNYEDKEHYLKQIKYWSEYWRGCTYYNLAIDKIQRKESFEKIKEDFENAIMDFQGAKKISDDILNIKNMRV